VVAFEQHDFLSCSSFPSSAAGVYYFLNITSCHFCL